MATRSAPIDALRGLAVFGILLVNVWGFASGFSLYQFPASGSLSGVDKLAVFVVAAFAEQKFYPIFAFLFGAGFALQTGGLRAPGPALDAIKATYRRRLRWLVMCGLLHGMLLWFGDILFAYSLTGFWLVRQAGVPLARLARTLRVLVLVNVLVIAVYVTLSGYLHDPSEAAVSAQLREMEAAHAAYSAGGWGDAALRRIKDFGINVSGFVIFVPRLALLFLLGVFAVRRGYLTRPRRHRLLWRRVLVTALVIGVPFNLLWGLIALAGVIDPFDTGLEHALMGALLDVGGPLLAAGIVALYMLARPGFGTALIPVGRMALTNYLSQSVILMLLLQGVGLGLGAVLSHAQLLAVCGAIMLAQLLFCRWWLAHHRQGPAEALWRRYTDAG